MTGDRWFDDLRLGWSTNRIKFLVDRIEKKTTVADESAEYIGLENVESWTGRLIPGESPAGEGTVNMFAAGDVLFGKLRPYLAKVYQPDRDGVCSTEFLVLRANGLSPSFLRYALSSEAFIAVVNAWTFGVKMPRANWNIIGNLLMPVPPHEEQRDLVAFLDEQTNMIDEFVLSHQDLLEGIKAKRSAIYDAAVTGGLSRDASVATSVPWLGETPSNWETKKNRHLFVEVNDRSTDGKGELLTVSHITGVTPRSKKNVNMFLAESLEGYKKCKTGDLVINTMWAWMGAMGIAPCAGLISPSYNVYRIASPDLLPEFYDLVARSSLQASYVKAISTGVWESRLRLYPQQFFRLRTVLPHLDEQRRIVACAKDLTSALEPVAQATQDAIGLLKERRSAMVSSAVTGRLKCQSNLALKVVA